MNHASSFDPREPHDYAVYLRMSSELQNERSPDAQKREIDSTVRRLGCPWREVAVYRDDAKSGRRIGNRPDFMRMLRDIETCVLKVDFVLVDTKERFGRMEELDDLLRKLRNRHGVLVLTADTHFADPTSAAGQALAMTENWRSKHFAQTLAHNVCRGKRYALEQGQWVGSPVPFGYRLESVMTGGDGSGPQEVAYRKPVPDPRTAPIVRKAFELARAKGWGAVRLAKHFNARSDLVEKFGRFHAETFGRMLSNPLYKGVAVWGKNTTKMVEDRRVIRANTGGEITVCEEYCQAIVAPELWDAVNDERARRGKLLKAARSANASAPSNKKIAPLSRGLVLKYPLTGLVRCGLCNASMRPMSSRGAGTKDKRRYAYYICPCHVGGSCANGIYLPERWLWGVVVAKLRERLLPAPGNGGAFPQWFAPLMAKVRAELERLSAGAQDRAPLLQRELDDLDRRVGGLAQSLANPDLPPEVRRLLEQQCQEAIARRKQVESELAALGNRHSQAECLLDPQRALECLHRLGEALENASPTELNLELGRHVERIEVFPDRRVVMRSAPLGCFEGLVHQLYPRGGAAGVAEDRAASTATPDPNRVVPAKRTRRGADSLVADVSCAAAGARFDPPDPARFEGLPAHWVWRDEFTAPVRRHWYEEHAAEVAAKRAQDTKHWSLARLKEHFGKSIPTIRKALSAAGGQQACDVARPAPQPRTQTPRSEGTRGQGRSVSPAWATRPADVLSPVHLTCQLVPTMEAPTETGTAAARPRRQQCR